jgi:diacylglycerol kinase (ATP)
MNPSVRSRTVLASFRFAFAGLWHVLRTQRNARIHLGMGITAVALGAVLGITTHEWLVLVLLIGLVFAAECFNTAVEALVDLFSPEWHERAKLAKDAAAATVLCTAFAAIVVGAIVFVPRLVELFTMQ